ncbi:hypothetical protein GCM10011575_19100 [Microlunatus endophyticus]|uniref:Uncharacterized protein n=1 Tax=Microlunatus endophyticus TaxID=1716077 RepID=A0A917S626_9ACTN|nr:hypothetical protein GCM10011575_19100 [Microlunatus endophyticus]
MVSPHPQRRLHSRTAYRDPHQLQRVRISVAGAAVDGAGTEPGSRLVLAAEQLVEHAHPDGDTGGDLVEDE